MSRYLSKASVARLRSRLKFWHGTLTGKYRLDSYAQEGEDRILARLLEDRKAGFYVDIGAHHPIRFSNTYLFYLMGWRGINIDANPGSMQAFRKIRPRDINLELGVGAKTEQRTLYQFNEPALNSFDADLSNLRNLEMNNFRIVSTALVNIRPVADILEEHIPQGTNISFLTIDVEGADLEVVKSNDWERFRPELVLIESLETDFDRLGHTALAEFLKDVGYRPFAKTLNTAFFQKGSQEI